MAGLADVLRVLAGSMGSAGQPGMSAAPQTMAGMGPNTLNAGWPQTTPLRITPPGQASPTMPQPLTMTGQNGMTPPAPQQPDGTPWYQRPGFIALLGNVARFGSAIAPNNPTAAALGNLGYGMAQDKLMADANGRILGGGGGGLPGAQGNPEVFQGINGPYVLPSAPIVNHAPSNSPGSPQAQTQASGTANLPPVGSGIGASASPQGMAGAQPGPLASTAPQAKWWQNYDFGAGQPSAPVAAPDFTGLSTENQQAAVRAYMAQQEMAQRARADQAQAALTMLGWDRQDVREERTANRPQPYFNEQGGFVFDPVTGSFSQQYKAPQKPEIVHMTPGSQVVTIDPVTGQKINEIAGPPARVNPTNYSFQRGSDGKLYAIDPENPWAGGREVPGVMLPNAESKGPGFAELNNAISNKLAMEFGGAARDALEKNLYGYDINGNPSPGAVFGGLSDEQKQEWRDLEQRMNRLIREKKLDPASAFHVAQTERMSATGQAGAGQTGQPLDIFTNIIAPILRHGQPTNAALANGAPAPTQIPQPVAPVASAAPAGVPLGSQPAYRKGTREQIGWRLQDGSVVSMDMKTKLR